MNTRAKLWWMKGTLSLILVSVCCNPLLGTVINHCGIGVNCCYNGIVCTRHYPEGIQYVTRGATFLVISKFCSNIGWGCNNECGYRCCEILPNQFTNVRLVGHHYDGTSSYNIFEIGFSNSSPYAWSDDEASWCPHYGYSWTFLDSVAPPDRCEEGDPVDPYLGNLDITGRDYSVPDRGLPFDFVRHYFGGQNECLGRRDSTMWRYPLGQGWTHPYNLYIDPAWRTDTTGATITKVDSVVYHDDKGRSWVFLKGSGDSIFQIPAGRNFQLRRTGTRWALYREDGSLCKFNSSGRLDTLDGRNGNKMVFTYDSRNNLSEIRSPSGRRYFLKYNFAAGDSHHLWKLFETSDTTTGPYLEYKYRITQMDSVDTTSAKPLWRYQLTEVFHHSGGAQDQVELLNRYYYGFFHPTYKGYTHAGRRLTVSVRPDTGYGGADTSYDNGVSSGDRLQCWYDNQDRVIYQEEADKNGNLVSQAFFKYDTLNSTYSFPDSTMIYYYQGPSGGAAHSITDTSFHPSPPMNTYFVKKIRWWNVGLMKGIPAWTRIYDPSTGESDTTFYANYNSNFRPGYVVGPRKDTTEV